MRAGAPSRYGIIGPMGYDFTPVEAYLHRLIQSIPLNGASICIIQDDEIIYRRAFGTYTLDERVAIASGTKWVTGAVIAALIDDGVLYLEERVSDYLPGFDGDKASITLQHLLAHTSGLPRGEASCIGGPETTLAACAVAIAQMPMVAAPGEQFAYGENAFQLAGRMVEVATGRSWEDVFYERLAGPLHMSSTDYGRHRREGGRFHTRNPHLGAGLRTTLDDYGNFVRMLANGGLFQGRRILRPETVALMHCDHTLGAPVAYSPNLFPGRGYGLGAWRDIVDEAGRAIQLSSPGASGFTPWVDVRRRLAGVFLVRDSYERMARPVNELQRLVREVVDAA